MARWFRALRHKRPLFVGGQYIDTDIRVHGVTDPKAVARNVERSIERKYRWQLEFAEYGDAKSGRLLDDGWEPFASLDNPNVLFRRRVRIDT